VTSGQRADRSVPQLEEGRCQAGLVPLLRITCGPDRTDYLVDLLCDIAGATEVSVVAGASRVSGGDLILAEVPRAAIDRLLDHFPPGADPAVHVAIEPVRQLLPHPRADSDDEAIVWSQVVQDVHETGRLSWVNVALVVVAACIAAIGLIEDQLLLIVGAMAISPDYFPIADTYLSIVRRAWRRAAFGAGTLALSFSAGAAGAFLLTEALVHSGLVRPDVAPSQDLTLFISQPDKLTVVVALLAGVAGALAITLPDARGLVGVFVSITTIPAAANIGVALVAHDSSQLTGSLVQLLTNVICLQIAGTATLAIRRALGR